MDTLTALSAPLSDGARNANALYEEARWEMEGIRRAARRYQEQAANAEPHTLPSGQWFLRQVVPPLVEVIQRRQKEAYVALGSKGKATDWSWSINTLPVMSLAFITVSRALDTARAPEPVSQVKAALTVVNNVVEEVNYQEWLHVERAAQKEAQLAGWHRPDMIAELKRLYPQVNRKTWARWKARAAIKPEKWTREERLALGAVLVDALLEAAPDYFVLHSRVENGKVVKTLQLTPRVYTVMMDIEARAEVAHPLETVMLIEPRPWERVSYPTTVSRNASTLRGGYVIHQLDPFGNAFTEHTRGLEDAVSDTDLTTWNALQATPYRVNTWLLDVMQDAYKAGLRLGGLEVGEPLPMPPKMPTPTWEALNDAQKGEVKLKRRELHRENVSIMGRSQSILDILMMGEELRHVERFWYPITRDFRHRLYMRATRGPHPQGSDIAKSLAMFAEGKALGADGFWWLAIRAANTFGMDKLTLEDRYAWTIDNLLKIRGCASDPLQFTWWTEADEPWSFLATCHEITMAIGQSPLGLETVHSFVSHLPIPMDGSCNGLQHLSAMGLDPTGAHATNLTPDPERQDIYTEIARKVALEVQQDVLDGVEAAPEWLDKVTRKTVKRAVMTTPYGVTPRGIRDQLISDKMIPAGAVGIGAKANYMTDKIQRALEGTVLSAKQIMDWLRAVAAALGKANVPFDWTTPSGSRVRQAYFEETVVRVETLLGKLSLAQENTQGSLVWRKQAAGSAPNVVHSFDAAHLSLTVNDALAAGISDFAMIHDSYATHAGNTTTLAVILRRAFVAIYRGDWLAKIAAEVRAYAPHIELPELPVRGDFDIEQVNDAEYFFS